MMHIDYSDIVGILRHMLWVGYSIPLHGRSVSIISMIPKTLPSNPLFSARLPLWLQLWDSFVRVTDSEATVHASAAADAAPQFFADAVESLYQAQLRPEISVGTRRSAWHRTATPLVWKSCTLKPILLRLIPKAMLLGV
mgnify:CR=1 FL=1